MSQRVSDGRIAEQRQKTWTVSEANVSFSGVQLELEMQNRQARTTLGFEPYQSNTRLHIHSTPLSSTKP